jgi:uncharacterized protein YrrD
MVSGDPGPLQLQSLLGRPVVNARTGQRIGRVRQVLLDLSGARLAGFRLRHGSLLGRRWRVAAIEDVVGLTDTAVLLPDDLALREDEQPGAAPVLGGRPVAVVCPDGAIFGNLVDAQADRDTRQLLAVTVHQTQRAAGRRGRSVRVPIERVRGGAGGTVLLGDVRDPTRPATTG